MFKFLNDLKEIKESIKSYDDKFSDLNNKLNIIFDIVNEFEYIHLANHTIDKFEDYMKNVDKLNVMINEFKGCVAMARSCVQESKSPGKSRKKK